MTRRQILMIAAPPLVVLIAWLALGWLPQRGERADASDRIEVMEAQSAAALAQLGSARKLEERADATALELAALRGRIPDDPDVGGFVLMNQALALAAGVVLTDVTPQADVEERFLPGADDLPASLLPTVVSITGTGSFDALWAYVQALTEAERLVVIDAISLDVEQEGVLRCTLLVRIFSTREPSSAEGGSAEDDLVTAAVPQ